jgi:hypothetical protein
MSAFARMMTAVELDARCFVAKGAHSEGNTGGRHSPCKVALPIRSLS